MNQMMPDGTYQPIQTAFLIDPLKISDRLFGGPHFAEFWMISETRAKHKVTGDVFDIRGLDDAWMEGRDLMPIVFGEGRKAIIQEKTT